jgi:hypothetical protein
MLGDTVRKPASTGVTQGCPIAGADHFVEFVLSLRAHVRSHLMEL